ncbi:MAG: GCN5-related N-acetyltransferase [Chitinophagaceae bacterium]|nr:GCN5-related N-acetyltransferase [Chitinophagaceae bacterium]
MIRKIENQDYEFIFNLYMHPDTNPYLMYEVMAKDAFLPIYQDLLQRDIVYVYSDEGKDIGMFKLVPLTYRSSHVAYLGGLAVHPSSAGKGYGFKMMQEIVVFAQKKGFLRIELSTAVTNEKAVHLYTKAGFEKEGILKKYTHLKSGNIFLDEVMMAWVI